jgi:hypothetical protein
MSAHDEAASRWLFACLSPYLNTPVAPGSNEDWQRIFELADDGLVLPRLALTVAERFPSAPATVKDYLDVVLTMSRLRNGQLREQLVSLIKSLNSRGVVPIVIKGATALLDETADVGARSMLDMDIWTPEPQDQAAAMECLADLGYRMREAMERYAEDQHYPPFFKDGALSRIELHRHMVNPRFAAMVDERAAAASCIERQYDGARFRVLARMPALALSYIQCRWACEQNTFCIMKWLDLVDRCKDMGRARIISCADLGVSDTDAAIDRQFLTLLSIMMGLPYEGVKDAALHERWARRNSQSVAIRFFMSAFQGVFDPGHWSGKRFSDVLRSGANRMKRLRQTYYGSKKLDRF